MNCQGCEALLSCIDRVERTQAVEDRARQIGALVAEGWVRCDVGPTEKRFVRAFEPAQTCQAQAVQPRVSTAELSAEIQDIWGVSLRTSAGENPILH